VRMRASLRERRRQVIYVVPNLLTTGNLFCGLYAIMAVFGANYVKAAIAILVASLASRRAVAAAAIVGAFLVTAPVAGVLGAIGGRSAQELAPVINPVTLVQGLKTYVFRFHEGLPIRQIAARWQADAAVLHHEYAKARREFKDALMEVVAFHSPGPPAALEKECAELLELLG